MHKQKPISTVLADLRVLLSKVRTDKDRATVKEAIRREIREIHDFIRGENKQEASSNNPAPHMICKKVSSESYRPPDTSFQNEITEEHTREAQEYILR